MRSLSLALCLPLALMAGPARADLPAPVAAALKSEARHCVEMGGKPQKPGPAAILTSDVNGDGQPDYLMDANDIICKGPMVSCGSGGCALDLWLSGPGGLVHA